MGLFNSMASNLDIEKEGVWLEVEGTRWRLARMGTNNKQFKKEWEKRIKPIRKAFEHGVVPDEKQAEIVKECFAIANVVDAEVLRDGKWVRGLDVEGDPKAVGEFTPAGVLAILQNKSLDNWWKLCLETATDARPYAASISTQEETGN